MSTLHIDKYGTKYYYNKWGVLHRTDGPALECVSGDKCWRFDGKPHRVNGPAIEWSDGTKEWYIHGYRHREDGPAIERANGDNEWYIWGENITKAK
jgi:hypothetical protein